MNIRPSLPLRRLNFIADGPGGRFVPGVLLVEYKEGVDPERIVAFNETHRLTIADVVKMPTRTVWVLQMARQDDRVVSQDETLAMVSQVRDSGLVKVASPNYYRGAN